MIPQNSQPSVTGPIGSSFPYRPPKPRGLASIRIRNIGLRPAFGPVNGSLPTPIRRQGGYGGGAGYITEMGFSGPTATGFVGGENRWFRIEAEADISALNPDSAIGFAGGMALYFKPVNFFAIGGEVGGQTISIGPRDEDRMEEGESGGTFYGLVGTAWVPIPKSGLTGGVRVHGGWVSGTHLNTVDYTAQPDLAGFRGLFSLVIQGGGHSGVTYTAPEE